MAFFGRVKNLIEKHHLPHGDAYDLQVIFPAKTFLREPGTVGVNSKIIVQRKVQKGQSAKTCRDDNKQNMKNS